jgi:hypothetical protein
MRKKFKYIAIKSASHKEYSNTGNEGQKATRGIEN